LRGQLCWHSIEQPTHLRGWFPLERHARWCFVRYTRESAGLAGIDTRVSLDLQNFAGVFHQPECGRFKSMQDALWASPGFGLGWRRTDCVSTANDRTAAPPWGLTRSHRVWCEQLKVGWIQRMPTDAGAWICARRPRPNRHRAPHKAPGAHCVPPHDLSSSTQPGAGAGAHRRRG